jgi:hypothetical protein
VDTDEKRGHGGVVGGGRHVGHGLESVWGCPRVSDTAVGQIRGGFGDGAELGGDSTQPIGRTRGIATKYGSPGERGRMTPRPGAESGTSPTR